MPRFAAWLIVLSCALPSHGSAQAHPTDGGSSVGVRLYVGLWTTHLRNPGRGFDSNWLVGVGWRGLYGGTFVNSFGTRAFAAGLARPLARSDEGRVARGVGYRLGLVTGYDERFIGLAGTLPILPMAQLVGDVAVGRTGVELAWSGLVASLGPYMRVAN
jgi:hypothetical protein